MSFLSGGGGVLSLLLLWLLCSGLFRCRWRSRGRLLRCRILRGFLGLNRTLRGGDPSGRTLLGRCGLLLGCTLPLSCDVLLRGSTLALRGLPTLFHGCGLLRILGFRYGSLRLGRLFGSRRLLLRWCGAAHLTVRDIVHSAGPGRGLSRRAALHWCALL